jgi:citronellol/citronellal dehydrogenase
MAANLCLGSRVEDFFWEAFRSRIDRALRGSYAGFCEGRMTRTLKGKTLFITGASRGIGKAIALRAARDGANVVIAAKTSDPNPKLPGTIFSAKAEIEAAGGRALACVVDVRFEEQILEAVNLAVKTFGGIDVLVNNASAISLTGTVDTPLKRFDLMHGINTRGTFACSQACIPHLMKAENPHILNISPPLNMEARWFGPHVAYTMAKFGMSMCVLGMAEELRGAHIAVNALWPKTVIATAAVQNLLGGDATVRGSRKPDIMADAAHAVLTHSSREFSGQFCIDEEVLRATGVSDFSAYAMTPGMPDSELFPDYFI